jgi:signal transduction histidine kinase
MNPNILVVDDDIDVQNVLSVTLTHLGYEVLKANNGEEGYKSFLNSKPEIIFSDIYMPKVDGFQFLKKVKNTTEEQEIVIITGFADMDTAIKVLREGASDFIPKPIELETLKMVLDRCEKRIKMKNELKNYINNLEAITDERTKKAIEQEKLAIIGRNTAGIIHNIANPLSSIKYRLEWNLMNCLGNEKEYFEYKELLKNINDISSLIGNTLLKLRNEAQIEKTTLDINQILKDQINFLKSDPRFKYDISIETSLKEDLHPIDGVYSDFSQIFNNLFINAADAMELSIEKRLIIKTNSNSNGIIINISDTGCGISKDNYNKIFDPLFSTKSFSKGTGLGLAVVKQLLESYNADICFESIINSGTVFNIHIPYKGK